MATVEFSEFGNANILLNVLRFMAIANGSNAKVAKNTGLNHENLFCTSWHRINSEFRNVLGVINALAKQPARLVILFKNGRTKGKPSLGRERVRNEYIKPLFLLDILADFDFHSLYILGQWIFTNWRFSRHDDYKG